jgi:hypothetical protein
MDHVEAVLDHSIATDGYVIRPTALTDRYIDLSKIDFQALKKKFENGRKPIEAKKLRSQIAAKVGQMLRMNRTRINKIRDIVIAADFRRNLARLIRKAEWKLNVPKFLSRDRAQNRAQCRFGELGERCKLKKRMAPQVGLEPTTLRLTARFRRTRRTKPNKSERKHLKIREAELSYVGLSCTQFTDKRRTFFHRPMDRQ